MVDTAARATPGAIVPDRPAALYTRGTTEDTPNPTNRNPAVAVTIFGKMTASNNPVAMTTPLICNNRLTPVRVTSQSPTNLPVAIADINAT